MLEEILPKFKEKFEKFGATLPLDWQIDIPVLLRQIDGIQSQIKYHSNLANKNRIENSELKKKIIDLENDKKQALQEVQELKLRKMV